MTIDLWITNGSTAQSARILFFLASCLCSLTSGLNHHCEHIRGLTTGSGNATRAPLFCSVYPLLALVGFC